MYAIVVLRPMQYLYSLSPPWTARSDTARGMDIFSLLGLLLLSTLPLFLIISPLLRRRSRCLNLPPRPPALPIIGHLSQLGSKPYRSLQRLSATYGPLMYLNLGQLPTVVVSSAAVAQEVLKTQDRTFCTRAPFGSDRKMYYGGMDVAFTPYNAYWRQARRIFTSELLSPSRVQSLRPIREEEVATLVSAIRRGSAADGSVNLSEMFLCFTNNITCREVFGRRFGREGECGRSRFHDLVTEWTTLFGHFNLGEYFPSMEWINVVTGLHRRIKKNFMELDATLEELIDQHLSGREKAGGVEPDHENYIISVLLELQNDPTLEIPLTRDHIKGILMDLFMAGTTGPAFALEWGMFELMRHPQVMSKAQAEVRAAAGTKDKLDETDLHHLQYLKQVVKEIMRLHPPAPFLPPRESMRDCVVDGYDIPAKTRVMINVWAIARDPQTWDDPEAFLPERFADSSVDYRGQHFQFLPFGSGRRVCPGISLGTVMVELALANLLRLFDWRMPSGEKVEDLDIVETFGIVLRRKSALSLAAVPHMNAN